MPRWRSVGYLTDLPCISFSAKARRDCSPALPGTCVRGKCTPHLSLTVRCQGGASVDGKCAKKSHKLPTPPSQEPELSRPDRFTLKGTRHRDAYPLRPMRGPRHKSVKPPRKPVRSFHENASANRLSNSPSTCLSLSPILPRSESTRATTPANSSCRLSGGLNTVRLRASSKFKPDLTPSLSNRKICALPVGVEKYPAT